MGILNNLLVFIDMILNLYMWVVIAAAIISWVSPDPRNPIVRFLYGVTEPVLYRIRRLIPTSFGGIDIAPMLLILAIIFVKMVIINSIRGMLMAPPMVMG